MRRKRHSEKKIIYALKQADADTEIKTVCRQIGGSPHKIIVSMSRKGNCWDNAMVESFFKTLKQEFIPSLKSKKLCLDDIRLECSKYMEKYNTKRIHSSLDKKSPQKYEMDSFS